MPFLRKNIRSLSTTVISALALASTSCAVHPPITEEEMHASRTYRPPVGMGILFVYRPSAVRAIAMPRPVIINGEHIVSITNGTFVAMPLKPGTYKIEAGAQAFIPDKEKRKAEPDITLKVEKGKTYFIRQFVEGSIIGNVGRSDVMMLQTGAGGPIPIMLGGDGPPPFKAAIVDGAQGREGCSKLKLVGSDPVP